MSDFVKRLARLPEDRRAEFLRKLRRGGGAAADEPELSRRPATARAPASHSQEQLWFLDQLAPGRSTYNVPICLRLAGRLDAGALTGALRLVVRRHEVLRSHLQLVDGELVQVVSGSEPDLPVVEISNRTDPAASAWQLVTEEAMRPFDLATGPLLRALLVRCSEREHLLLLTLHHVVFDGWSVAVLGDELAAGYSALVRGTVPDRPELPVQYGDYAVWQRARLRGPRLDGLTTYWRRALHAAPVLELPTDHPRPVRLTFDGALTGGLLPAGLRDSLTGLASARGTTLFPVLLAGLAVVLRRYSGQDDIVLGSPSANRTRPELEGLIGFFVNMLVLRTEVDGRATFGELVDRVHATVLDGYAHQELPFEKVVDAVRAPRDPNRSPIFQAVLTLQNAGQGGDLAFDDLDVEVRPVHVGTSRFDLSLNVTETDAGLALDAEFNTNLFTEQTIARLLGHYERLLRAAVADPDRAVDRLPVLGDDELHRMLLDWNDTAAPVTGTVVPDWFGRQVAATPDAVAVTFRDGRLTYAELNARACRLAALLRARGVGPEVRVGLCLERSIDQVVAVLAVLKAGGAFVPLDPAHPPARIRFMLDDSAAALLLTHRDVLARLGDPGRPALRLDHPPDLAAEPASEQASEQASERAGERAGTVSQEPVRIGPGNLAYVIYTSGSTGQPKGVMIEHRSVVAFVEAVRELFAITPADRVLNFASPSFDVSVFEMFSALLSGATLCIADEDQRLSPDRLTELMVRQRVTITDLPPSVMKLLPAGRFDDLRIVFVGGEPFTEELVRAWSGPGRRFVNGYGPTECTVTMTVKDCEAEDVGTPPIGRPTRNHRCYVLDPAGRPVPVGVPGELCIGGAGLARGYQHRAGHTADRFVPDPFCGARGERMYRTGDLVKYLPNGDLVFLGRIDRQVKINGLRIELSEIESVLRQHPTVRHAVVDVWPDPTGHRHLVAWLDHAAGAEPLGTAQVRAHLGERLPAYMLPAFVVPVAEIPLTASGKVDHGRLPAPDPERLTTGNGGQPGTETERTLAERLFAPILGLSRVGVHDNFFDLGGNSLQAAQLTSGIRATFGVELALGDFFASPTVAHLASVVDRLRDDRPDDLEHLVELAATTTDTAAGRSGAPAITELRPGTGEPIVLVHPVGGALFCYAELVRALPAGRPVAGLAADELLDADRPPQLPELARHYLDRLRSAGVDPRVLAGWSFGGVLAHEMARQLTVDGLDGAAGPNRSDAVPLVLIDAMPWPAGEPTWDGATLRRAFVEDLLRSAGLDVELASLDGGVWLRPLPEALRAITERYPAARVRLDDDELRARFRTYRNATAALQGHRPAPYDGPVALMRADGSPVTAAAWSGPGLVESVLPGDHYTLLRPPVAGELAAELHRVAERTTVRSGS